MRSENNEKRHSILSDLLFDGSNLLKTISDLSGIEVLNHTLHMADSSDPYHRNHGDPVNEYKLNSMGYRSIEFKKVPLITAGCSITYGVGVPVDATWAGMLSAKLNQEYVSLAGPGWSTEAIVDNLFKYFYKYGNPETLAVLFPEYTRVVYPSYRGYAVVPDRHGDDIRDNVWITHMNMSNVCVIDRPKYSKAPHDMRDMIVPEYGVFRAFKSINSLISYCNSANIKLIWSTWDSELDSLIVQAKNGWNAEAYRGYMTCHPEGELFSDCHLDYEKQYGENFYRGYDGLLGKTGTHHPGIHYHVHAAEKFYKKLEDLP